MMLSLKAKARIYYSIALIFLLKIVFSILEWLAVVSLPGWVSIFFWVLLIPLLLVTFIVSSRELRIEEDRLKGYCVNCGYDLKGLVKHGERLKCPECGEENLYKPDNPEDQRPRETF